MKILGFFLIAFGLVDLIGSYADFDLWGGFLGIQLPDTVWQYSSFIEMGLGYALVSLSKKTKSSNDIESASDTKA